MKVKLDFDDVCFLAALKKVLLERRNAAGLSLYQIARRSGEAHSTLRNFFARPEAFCSITSLRRLAHALEAPLPRVLADAEAEARKLAVVLDMRERESGWPRERLLAEWFEREVLMPHRDDLAKRSRRRTRPR